MHLSFPVRSISRGTVIGIALTWNQSPLDVKTLSSFLKMEGKGEIFKKFIVNFKTKYLNFSFEADFETTTRWPNAKYPRRRAEIFTRSILALN